MKYLKKELNRELDRHPKKQQINWTWSGMTGHTQSTSK